MNDGIGARLSDLLASHDLTQREFAKAIDVSNATIWRICHDSGMPTGTVLIKIADYFGVSIDWLVGRDEYEN